MNKFIFIVFLLIFSMGSYAEGILVCGEDGYCYYEDEDIVAHDENADTSSDADDSSNGADSDGSSNTDNSSNDNDEIKVAKVRTLALNIHPRNGTVALINGELVYTPNPGFYGEDYFTYIDDNGKLRTVKLFIRAPSDGKTNDFSVSEPVSQPEQKPTVYATTAKPGEPLIINVGGDYKPGQQNLKIDNPAHGKVVDNNDSTLTYTSEQNYSGKDTFSYKVDNKYTFIIEIEIISQQVSVMEPISQYVDYTVRAGMILTIDISVNYNRKTQIVVIKSSANSTIRKVKETLFYSSNPDFKGYDNFSYTVTDKDEPSNSNTYTNKVKVEEEHPFKQMSMASCRVYAVNDKDFANSQLLSIDPSKYDPFEVNSLASFEIGPVYIGMDIEGMAIDPTSNIVYGVTGNDYSPALDGRLYEINVNVGDVRDIGDTGFMELASLAFHSDGTLWAWSNGGSKDKTEGPGLILIDPQTAVSQMVYPMPKDFFDMKKGEKGIEGLAWSSDGSTLYATEGKKLWQWTCETGFELKCPNVINLKKEYQVEALETLADGMLLFSIDGVKSNTAYVYNPSDCSVIHEQPFKTSANYDDIESVVWPLNCQYSTPISNEQVTFDDFSSSQKEICLEEPQWIEVTGRVNISNGSIGYLKTSWASSENVTDQCTSCGNCSEKWQTITSVTNQFKIKAWWPGMTGKTVTTSYIVELHNKNRDIISTDEVTLVGNPAVCEANPSKTSSNKSSSSKSSSKTDNEPTKTTVAPPPPIVDPLAPSTANIGDYLGSETLRLNNDGSFAIQFENKVYNYKFQGSLPALPNKALSIDIDSDVNNDGYVDYSILRRTKTGTKKHFQILYLGTTDAQSESDVTIPNSTAIKEELKSSSPNISNAGIITIELNGQSHSYSFKGSTPLLPLSGTVTVQKHSDVNGDNYTDYHITDGSGKEYNLLYLGM
ncbi:Ig-like domain-containing protein [Candidatus Halobeggiatoa sp. HSG11]|nr:Ig-like domain-containing protein [Candidatus Halobeggiatoa sp. HSG11]